MKASFDPDGDGSGPLLGRRRVTASAVLAALGLHLAALAGVGAVVTHWSTRGAGSNEAIAVGSVIVVPPVSAGGAPKSPASDSSISLRHDARVAARQPSPRVASPTAAHPVTAPTDPAEAIRYYSVGEVDHPAMPESDWNLDAAALDAAGLSRMVFEVLISSTGAVIACAILEPTALSDELRQSLEAGLQRTVMHPALRGDAAVPSRRRIEMSVLPAAE